jgi:hypothetical protein
MNEQSKRREEALIQVWNRLEGMWKHHQDGSDFSPDKFLPNNLTNLALNNQQIKDYGKESVLFDIVFNEIQNLIAKNVSPLRKRDLN